MGENDDENKGQASSGHNDNGSITWRENDVPQSVRFDDPFYSLTDGAAEARHVFLDGNGLPDRWASEPYFSIAELGFGTGLNFLETWLLWRQTRPFGAQLSFTSFEAFPLPLPDIARALARFPHLAELADRMLITLPSQWPTYGEERPIRLDRQTQLMVVVGDARQTVPEWPGHAHAWFLDGFSPARNPELWEEPLMDAVYRKTRAGGSAATYSAAGWVRKNLEACGFRVERKDGFGSKRHMTVATRRKER